MADFGDVGCIIGIIEVGAKLSVILFDFARSVGSAGTDMTQIGIEISLFCSVSKQLHSTLTKTRRCRYSIGALEQTIKIMHRCREIFNEIEKIVSGLRFNDGKDRDVVTMIVWTFNRSDVRMLRTTLESCKITLHLMLHTLEIAQKDSKRSTKTEVEDGQEDIRQILEAARQCTITTLEQLENENPEIYSTRPSQMTPWKPNARSADKIRKIKPSGTRHQGTIGSDLGTKLASVWVKRLIVDEMNNSLVSVDFQQSSSRSQGSDDGEQQEHSSMQELEAIEANTRFKNTTTPTFLCLQCVSCVSIAVKSPSCPGTAHTLMKLETDLDDLTQSVIARLMKIYGLLGATEDYILCFTIDNTSWAIRPNERVSPILMLAGNRRKDRATDLANSVERYHQTYSNLKVVQTQEVTAKA